MSVIGIDFGNDSCYIAVARAGGIETLANDYSLRATPAYVAFGERSRILGVAAKNQIVTNLKNTVHNFKHLLGKHYDDPAVQKEKLFIPYNIVKTSTGGIGIKVRYMGEEQTFSPEQITAMLFTKLKEIAEANLPIKVNDCVVSVPCYFTESERRALMDAAYTAGLNVLRLFNEPCAVALAYGIYKQDLPAVDEKPRNVVFVDCGQHSLQVAACAFHRGKLKMLSYAWDAEVGGRDFDLLLAKDLAKEFLTKYKINAEKNPRAFLRLQGEVDKLKKQMSANSTPLPISIECFMDDKDVHAIRKRTDFEDLIAPLMKRVEATLRSCLEQSKLSCDEIYAVEVVGGSTRMPILKQLCEQVYGIVPSTTLNQDEAVSRGCALQCAMVSPVFKVREFSVSDLQPYPIKLTWDSMLPDEDGEMEVFAANHAVPFSKILTFYRKEPFTLKAVYVGNVTTEPFIGQYQIKDVKPTADNDPQKVKVKVRVNTHGIFVIVGATLVERKDGGSGDSNDDVQTDTTDEKMESDVQVNHAETDAGQKDADGKPQSNGADNEQGGKMDTDPAAESAPVPEKAEETKEKKKKAVLKSIDLPIDSVTRGLVKKDLEAAHEQEGKMISHDRLEKERVDARNAVEEYVYDIRGKIQEGGDLHTYMKDGDKVLYLKQLESTENWLYEEGDDCNKQIYVERLQQLKSIGEPPKVRYRDNQERPLVIDVARQSLQRARKVVELWRSGDDRYSHLEQTEVEKLDCLVKSKAESLENTATLLARTPNHVDPPITSANLKQETQAFEMEIGPIVHKAKPKVEPPPPAPTPENSTDEKQEQATPENSTPNTAKPPEEQMDLD